MIVEELKKYLRHCVLRVEIQIEKREVCLELLEKILSMEAKEKAIQTIEIKPKMQEGFSGQ